MRSLSSAVQKTCLAFTFRTSQFLSQTAAFPQALRHQVGSVPSAQAQSTRLFGVKFEPSPPPGTHGTPVFPDITFSDKRSDNAELRNSDPNAVFVVTGASRGIGLQFVKTLYQRTQGKIVACCRSPQSAEALDKFCSNVDNPDRIAKIHLNLEDQQSIENMGNLVKEKYNRVDMLLNVAGLLGDGKTTPGPERSLAKIDRTWMETTMAVNTIGPVMVAQELAPLMMQRRKRGKQQSRDDDGVEQRTAAIVANLSARVGSISDNSLGGWYSYRVSKSALNQFTRTMALEMKRHNVLCIAMHPGTTRTDLSKPFQANVREGSLFPVQFTVDSLLAVLDNMEEDHSGGLYDWAGQSLSF